MGTYATGMSWWRLSLPILHRSMFRLGSLRVLYFGA